MGFASVATGNGSTTTIVDAVLRDQGVTAKFLESLWIYFSQSGTAAADLVRRVQTDGFTIASGTLTWARTGETVASAEAYQVFALLPPIDQAGEPYSWDRAINDGLAECPMEDHIVLGRGRIDLPVNRFHFDKSEVTLVAAIAVQGGTNVTITATGWTLIRRSNSGTSIALATYYRRALLDQAIEFDFTLDSSRVAAGMIAAYVDANPNDPVDVDGETATTPASVTATAPAVTTTVDYATLLHVYGSALGAVMNLPVTASERYERMDTNEVDGTADIGLMLEDEEQDADGASTARTVTLGQSAINIGQTIALQPSSQARRVAFVTVEQANTGTGSATLTIRRPSSIPNDDWEPTASAVQRVLLRTVDSDGNYWDVEADRNGRFYRTAMDEGRLAVELYPTPSTDQIVVAVVSRGYPNLVADADLTNCPTDLAWKAARWKVYEHLNQHPATVGKYKEELRSAYASFAEERRRHTLVPLARAMP